jgi:hypothetical protein
VEIFVKFEVFDTVHEQEYLLALRQVVGRQMQQIQESER